MNNCISNTEIIKKPGCRPDFFFMRVLLFCNLFPKVHTEEYTNSEPYKPSEKPEKTKQTFHISF